MPLHNLEETVRRAIVHASERRHEFVTLEHLLLSLTEDREAVTVLRACGVDLDTLREGLVTYLDNDLAYLIKDSKADPRTTDSFNRALQRAVIHVQSVGAEEVTGAKRSGCYFLGARKLSLLFPERAGYDPFPGDGLYRCRAAGRKRNIDPSRVQIRRPHSAQQPTKIL